MSRYSRSEVDIDARYDDRRSTAGPRGTRTESRYEDIDVDFRRGSGPVPTRERQTVLVKEKDDYERRGTTPAFLRDDYGGNTTAGAMVLRERDREDITYAPARRRRSPSREREEIVIRRDERSESRPAAPRPRIREQSREREEIIIRRDERSHSRPPAPRRREQSTEREEIIIRRDERESVAPPRRAPTREYERDREEIIIKRDDRDTRSRFEEDVISERSYRPPPPPVRDNVDRSEIIIRREQIEPEEPPPPPRVRKIRYDEDIVSNRPVSRERARSRGRDRESFSDDEIIIRRDKSETRGGREETREEIIIRRSSRSRSPSPTASVSTRAAPVPMSPPEPQIIYAPQIHQEVITHHRHVDHGYEVRNARRENVYSRPPSPPSPPPAPVPMSVRGRSRSMSEERIEIKRSDTRNGRRETEDIVISRNERSVSRGPPPRAAETRMTVREEEREDIDISSRRGRSEWEERNIEEEAEYYNDRALSRGYPGEAYHGATRDWGLVDIPPGTRRVKMDGAGGGAQEITWKRYDGNRRAKFYPDGDDEGYTTDPGRPTPRHRPIREPSPELPAPTIAARFGNRRDPREGLWTEVTKDLVIKEAIEEMGWEYQETDEHYYIFRYMEYVSIATR